MMENNLSRDSQNETEKMRMKWKLRIKLGTDFSFLYSISFVWFGRVCASVFEKEEGKYTIK